MVSLKGVMRTLKTTRNFWDALALFFSKERKAIFFRNGLVLKVNQDEYLAIRDLISAGYNVEQFANGMFHVVNSKHELTIDSRFLYSSKLMLGKGIRRVQQTGFDTFTIETDEFKLVGGLLLFMTLNDYQAGTYNCNCFHKTVLDIGGFQGETAVFFSKMGARKIVIYEPVVAHHKFIKENLALNNVEAELHEEGIGDTDGIETIHYRETDLGFGLARAIGQRARAFAINQGVKEMVIKIRNISRVLEESHADIAKINCEGAEMSLVHVPLEILSRVGYYIVGVHTEDIRAVVLRKFKEAGFEVVMDIDVDHFVWEGIRWDISVLHLRNSVSFLNDRFQNHLDALVSQKAT